MSDDHKNLEKHKLSDFEARILMSVVSMHVSIIELSMEISRTKKCIAEAFLSEDKVNAIAQINDLLKKGDVDLSKTKDIINRILEEYEP